MAGYEHISRLLAGQGEIGLYRSSDACIGVAFRQQNSDRLEKLADPRVKYDDEILRVPKGTFTRIEAYDLGVIPYMDYLLCVMKLPDPKVIRVKDGDTVIEIPPFGGNGMLGSLENKLNSNYRALRIYALQNSLFFDINVRGNIHREIPLTYDGLQGRVRRPVLVR